MKEKELYHSEHLRFAWQQATGWRDSVANFAEGAYKGIALFAAAYGGASGQSWPLLVAVLMLMVDFRLTIEKPEGKK